MGHATTQGLELGADPLADRLAEKLHDWVGDLSASSAAGLEQLHAMAAQHKMAVVPLHLTRSMQEVLSDEWEWEDVLAAAEAITEEQYAEVSAGPSAAQRRVEELECLLDAAIEADKDRAKTIIELRKQLASSAAGQWISVDDRLPEEGETVFALIYPYNNKENKRITTHAIYGDGSFLNHEGDDLHPPTHWMPMPDIAALTQPNAAHHDNGGGNG